MKSILLKIILFLPLALGASDAVLKSLHLEANTTALNLGEKAKLSVTGNYDNGNTKDMTDQVAWIIAPSSAVEINATSLTALKDTNVTVQARIGTLVSNTLNLEIYWEVNGHRLPPEPDPAVNDSTLLGIDTNNNDVRDDVERWIYREYKDEHPIYIDIAMQAGRAYKLVLQTPEKAKEIHDTVNAPIDCEAYYKYSAKYYNEPILIKESIFTRYFIHGIFFNTEERERAFIQYDTLLSGDSYTLPEDQEQKARCDFNTSKY